MPSHFVGDAGGRLRPVSLSRAPPTAPFSGRALVQGLRRPQSSQSASRHILCLAQIHFYKSSLQVWMFSHRQPHGTCFYILELMRGLKESPPDHAMSTAPGSPHLSSEDFCPALRCPLVSQAMIFSVFTKFGDLPLLHPWCSA